MIRTEDSTLATLLHRPTKSLVLTATLIMAIPAAHAVGFGDMFNPGRWFGGDDDYYDGPWGPYGYGPYGGAPGYGPYAPYGGYGGYGAYGAPAYGAPTPGYGAPGYGAPSPDPYGYGTSGQSAGGQAASGQGDDAKDREIEALKRRIEQLEARGGGPSQPQSGRRASGGGGGWPSAPAFRPLD